MQLRWSSCRGWHSGNYFCNTTYCILSHRDAEQIKELKGNLKKAQAELKERSLLLDMYKTCTKETRDKVALI